MKAIRQCFVAPAAAKHEKSTHVSNEASNEGQHACSSAKQMARCAICLDDIAIGKLDRISPSVHTYLPCCYACLHMKCAEENVKRNGERCPMCRQSVRHSPLLFVPASDVHADTHSTTLVHVEHTFCKTATLCNKCGK